MNPVLEQAQMISLEKTGGKIVCSLSALPTWGPGRLFLRDDGKQHGDAEKKLFATEHPGWKKMAEKMVAAGVGVDFFLAAPGGGYLDIATIGHVSASTGGETFYYPNFVSPRDSAKLSQEIMHTVQRETGFQALMKVRCSNGLQVSSYHGNFVQHNFGADVEFGVIDADKAMGVMFSYDGKLDAKLDAHFQSALLYTTANGERRVRCSNVIASVSDSVMDCMKFVDQDAVYCLMAKEAASKMTTSTMKEIRGALTEKTVDIVAGYRKIRSGSHPPSELVLPENLKELGMYILGLIKSRSFKGGQEPTDRRVHDMRMLKGMGALELSLYLYPRMIPIHNLQPEDGFPDPETGHLRMPPSVRCSFSRVEEENHFKTHGEYLAIYDEYKLGLSSYDAIDKQAGTAKHYGWRNGREALGFIESLYHSILTEAALVTEMYMINEYGPPHGISGHRKYTFSITIWAISAFAAVTAGLAWRAEKHLPVHWNVNRANAITGVPPPANPRVPAQNAGAGLQVIQEEQEEEGIEMEDMAPAGQEDGDAELQDVPPRLEEDGAFEMVDMAPARREDGDVGLRHMPPVVHEDENPEGQDLSTVGRGQRADPSPEVEGAAGNRNLRARIRRASTIFTRSSGESDLENAVSARDGV
ncbi:hypothetical protein M7I_6505 [Glarea lozoyensis 74030]|uniref:Uncharacterized protein n=1 Tax=Glarea lozoyensis (strain ATCC 74030 / MF5533) TaxID=1104152 RepID=H0EUR6_GLAL7|nr:hypothetical protein M7I_6505 [Glarea lozoyensis 74030]